MSEAELEAAEEALKAAEEALTAAEDEATRQAEEEERLITEDADRLAKALEDQGTDTGQGAGLSITDDGLEIIAPGAGIEIGSGGLKITSEDVAKITVPAEGVAPPDPKAVEALTGILVSEAEGETSGANISTSVLAAGSSGLLIIGDGEAEKASTDEAAGPSSSVVIEVTDGDIRTSDQDFEFAAIGAEALVVSSGGKREKASELEKYGLVVLGGLAVGAVLNNGDKVVSNTGDRVVVEQGEDAYVVLKDDDALLRRPGSMVETQTYSDGSTISLITRADSSQIETVRDASGRVLRRTSMEADGTKVVLIDDLAPVERVDLSSLSTKGAEVDTGADSEESELAAAVVAVEAEEGGRSFTLRQVREYEEVRALAAELDLAGVNFETASAAIRASEARKLAELGRTMTRMIAENPAEVFLIEGHTDAVGGTAYNLALSDRRAESLALALTEYYNVPPENMVIQGYGEGELLVPTTEAEAQNRRSTVRVITPLLRVSSLQ
jgi:outer membrane protein OmpA-like peptidoglycan-associated protein